MTAGKKVSYDELKTEVEALLSSSLSDVELRKELERLAGHLSFSGLTWLWAPPLYGRNRVIFRPFILSHFSSILFRPPHKWQIIRWKGEAGRKLEEMLQKVDMLDDIELFRRLYGWKVSSRGSFRIDTSTVMKDLLERFRNAQSTAGRRVVLEKFNLWFSLDEPTATELYKIDGKLSSPFILRHLPLTFWQTEKRSLWKELKAIAESKDDFDLVFSLYRRQISVREWQEDILGLCDSVKNPALLQEELGKRHPEGFGIDFGDAFYQLALKRGEDVFPYIIKNLRRVWFRKWWQKSGFEKLTELAKEKGWLKLWGALVRITATPSVYNREIASLIDSASLPEGEVRNRLLLLAGVSRELNFPGVGLAEVPQLEDAAAVKFYRRFPGMLRGPFKKHISVTWRFAYPGLTELLFASGDEELIDFFASRLAARGGFQMDKDLLAAIEKFAGYYEALKGDQESFSRRVSEVLGQIPAFSIYNYNALIRDNRLARLLFERSVSSLLDDEWGMKNLVEASEIHVQLLAYRALSRDDDRARKIAEANLDILRGTLLRPLHRRTRIHALGALLNAAQSIESAQIIHRCAREALDLPNIKYPREKLAGLIGRLLHRWPQLRDETEKPCVYRRSASCSQ